MTIAERNNKLKHFITCLKCEVSGKVCDDNCSTQYEAGNMGEIIENLEAISKALEQEPCDDWCNVPSDKMTLEQARQAVKDLRKKLAERLKQKSILEEMFSHSDTAKHEYIHKDNFLVDLHAQVPLLIAVKLNTITEQEIVKTYLDKIRDEIEQLPTKTRTNWDGCCPDIDYPEIEYVDVTKAKLLKIIDKYKEEFKSQESEDNK